MIIVSKIHVFWNKKGKQIFMLHVHHKNNKILLAVKIRKQDFNELIENNNYQILQAGETTIFQFT